MEGICPEGSAGSERQINAFVDCPHDTPAQESHTDQPKQQGSPAPQRKASSLPFRAILKTRNPRARACPPVASAFAPTIERAPISAPSSTAAFHADQNFISNRAGVRDRPASNRDTLAHKSAVIVRHMDDGTVLDIRSRADPG
jgi:hypothetical protein